MTPVLSIWLLITPMRQSVLQSRANDERNGAGSWQSVLAIKRAPRGGRLSTSWITAPTLGHETGRARRPGRTRWPSGAGGAGSSPAGGALGFGWPEGDFGLRRPSTREIGNPERQSRCLAHQRGPKGFAWPASDRARPTCKSPRDWAVRQRLAANAAPVDASAPGRSLSRCVSYERAHRRAHWWW